MSCMYNFSTWCIENQKPLIWLLKFISLVLQIRLEDAFLPDIEYLNMSGSHPSGREGLTCKAFRSPSFSDAQASSNLPPPPSTSLSKSVLQSYPLRGMVLCTTAPASLWKISACDTLHPLQSLDLSPYGPSVHPMVATSSCHSALCCHDQEHNTLGAFHSQITLILGSH